MAQTTATEVRAGILVANETFMAAFSRGDAAACAACYTEQGQVLPPNSDVITGRQAIQTFWQGAMHTGITAVEAQPELRTAVIHELSNADNAFLSDLLRTSASGQAEDVATQVLRDAIMPEIRVKASSVLQRLRAGS